MNEKWNFEFLIYSLKTCFVSHNNKKIQKTIYSIKISFGFQIWSIVHLLTHKLDTIYNLDVIFL